MNRHQERMNRDIMEKINQSLQDQQGNKKLLKKSMSMKPGYKPKRDKKSANNMKSDLAKYQSDLRSLSSDIRTYSMSKTLTSPSKNKRKRVKFRTKFIDIVEIESYKQFLESEIEEDKDNTQDCVPLIAKKPIIKMEETSTTKSPKPYNHKLNNSNPESGNRAKCCACIIF